MSPEALLTVDRQLWTVNPWSEQAESDFDDNSHWDGNAVAQGWLEFPSPDGFQSLFVKP